MKLFPSILLIVPLLASCDPAVVHIFEPRISGAPIRTPDARAQLRAEVERAAARHDLDRDDFRTKDARPAESGAVVEAPLVSYYKRMDSGSLSMELYRDHSSGTDKIRLIDWLLFRRSDESKALEHEIQANLP